MKFDKPTVRSLLLDGDDDERKVLLFALLARHNFVSGRLLSLARIGWHREEEAVRNHVAVNHLRLNVLDGLRLRNGMLPTVLSFHHNLSLK